MDKIFHQPVRTRIAAYLATRGEATFSDLKRELEITDGNLEAHMKKLIAAEYVDAKKSGYNDRPQTFYALSALGEKCFERYVGTLMAMLTGVPK